MKGKRSLNSHKSAEKNLHKVSDDFQFEIVKDQQKNKWEIISNRIAQDLPPQSSKDSYVGRVLKAEKKQNGHWEVVVQLVMLTTENIDNNALLEFNSPVDELIFVLTPHQIKKLEIVQPDGTLKQPVFLGLQRDKQLKVEELHSPEVEPTIPIVSSPPIKVVPVDSPSLNPNRMTLKNIFLEPPLSNEEENSVHQEMLALSRQFEALFKQKKVSQCKSFLLAGIGSWQRITYGVRSLNVNPTAYRGYLMVSLSDIPKALTILKKVAEKREKEGKITDFKWLEGTIQAALAKLPEGADENFLIGRYKNLTIRDPRLVIFAPSKEEVSEVLEGLSSDPEWEAIENRRNNQFQGKQLIDFLAEEENSPESETIADQEFEHAPRRGGVSAFKDHNGKVWYTLNQVLVPKFSEDQVGNKDWREINIGEGTFRPKNYSVVAALAGATAYGMKFGSSRADIGKAKKPALTKEKTESENVQRTGAHVGTPEPISRPENIGGIGAVALGVTAAVAAWRGRIKKNQSEREGVKSKPVERSPEKKRIIPDRSFALPVGEKKRFVVGKVEVKERKDQSRTNQKEVYLVVSHQTDRITVEVKPPNGDEFPDLLIHPSIQLSYEKGSGVVNVQVSSKNTHPLERDHHRYVKLALANAFRLLQDSAGCPIAQVVYKTDLITEGEIPIDGEIHQRLIKLGYHPSRYNLSEGELSYEKNRTASPEVIQPDMSLVKRDPETLPPPLKIPQRDGELEAVIPLEVENRAQEAEKEIPRLLADPKMEVSYPARMASFEPWFEGYPALRKYMEVAVSAQEPAFMGKVFSYFIRKAALIQLNHTDPKEISEIKEGRITENGFLMATLDYIQKYGWREITQITEEQEFLSPFDFVSIALKPLAPFVDSSGFQGPLHGRYPHVMQFLALLMKFNEVYGEEQGPEKLREFLAHVATPWGSIYIWGPRYDQVNEKAANSPIPVTRLINRFVFARGPERH